MMRKTIALILLMISSLSMYAQKVSLSGTIVDGSSGESLIGAAVYLQEIQSGVATNAYGFYSMTVPAGTYTVQVSYLGYKTFRQEITLQSSKKLNIDMEPTTRSLGEVVIEGDTYKEQVRSTQMSVTKVTAKEAKDIPALFGEVDIIKTLQLKPGVQSGGEGTSGLYIRGGGADQNLIVLDEAIVYNASHLFGFFSTFNADAVKNIQLYKGGFPAQYGGRLSSVVDVSLRDGNNRKFGGSGGLGIIASRLTLEGPLVKDKSSFIVSGRRTYVDLITRQVNKANENKPNATLIPDYHFYDLNAKVNYQLSDKDRIYLSGYFGRDVFGFSDGVFNFGFDWGNATGTARWNHIFGDRLFSNTSLILSDYRYKIENQFDAFRFELGSDIRDINVKSDFLFNPNENHNLKFGAQYIYHTYNIGRLKFEVDDQTSEEQLNIERGKTLYGNEFGMYFSDDIKLNARTKLNLGIRLSGFNANSKTHFGFEPRTAFNYQLDENSALKASYTRMMQYNHLVSNSGASLPTDIWYPTTDVVKPQIADQIAVGYTRTLWKDKFLLSNEVYFKALQNQIDLKDNANIFVNDELEGEFVFGRGWSYGNEIFLEKKSGKTTGWIGYTLAWAYRQFDASNGNKAINKGEAFNPTYDRRHDVSIVVIHRISDRLSVTGAWVYGSGAPTTLPTGFFALFDVNGERVQVVPDVDERANYRYNPYHRLDLGLVWRFRPKWGESDLTLSVYNAYDRRNPYFIYYDSPASSSDVPSLQFEAKQVSLFPILPSITYNFKF